jgi:hypothetical protein
LSDSKRTGSRDISDLKARLGLKKGGAAPSTGQTGSNRSVNGGVVAPPGLNLPPPPGMELPKPTGPVIPNAADDPFGAMNAMAAVATHQRAPEVIVIRDDGKPVDTVGQKSTLASVLAIGLPAVFGLVIGVLIGKILLNTAASGVSKDEARELLGEKSKGQSIIGLRQTLSAIDTALDDRSKAGFRPDKKFDTDLKALAAKLDVKEKSVLARAKSLGDDLAGNTLAFYSGVAEVKNLIDTHVKAAQADNNAFTKGKEKMDAATEAGELRWAVMVQAPTDQERNVPFGARLVEIGGYYCNGGDKVVPKCGDNEQITAVAYRAEVGSTLLTKGDIAAPTSDTIPTKKILQLVESTVRDSFIKGADGVASEVYYQKRLRTLFELLRGKVGPDGKPTGGLIDVGNELERKMTTEINR